MSPNTVILYNENPSGGTKSTSNSVSSISSLEQSSLSISPIQLFNGSFVWLKQLNFNLADSMEQCFQALTSAGLPIAPDISTNDQNSMPWCNATWDTVRVILFL